ncbi:MAG TPA: hypothetical protein V6C81_01325 [Planktothrix sp.]|jgi:hypothetical protein
MAQQQEIQASNANKLETGSDTQATQAAGHAMDEVNKARIEKSQGVSTAAKEPASAGAAAEASGKSKEPVDGGPKTEKGVDAEKLGLNKKDVDGGLKTCSPEVILITPLKY